MNPTLAELTINLTEVMTYVKYIIAGIMGLIGLFTVGPPIFSLTKSGLSKLKLPAKTSKVTIPTSSTEPAEGRSSDAKPPEGFSEHLALIKGASPNGNPTVWWEYALRGLTEAEVAKEEAKLVVRTSTATTTVEEVKS